MPGVASGRRGTGDGRDVTGVDDHLIITAYNIAPDGQKAKAVETSYVRRGR